MKNMEKYRCLTDFYGVFTNDVIYNEFQMDVDRTTVGQLSEIFPDDWELVSENPQLKGNPTPFELLDYLAEKEREFKKNNR